MPEASPDRFLEDGRLLIIGGLVQTDLGGVIDLLGVDREGNVVVVEVTCVEFTFFVMLTVVGCCLKRSSSGAHTRSPAEPWSRTRTPLSPEKNTEGPFLPGSSTWWTTIAFRSAGGSACSRGVSR